MDLTLPTRESQPKKLKNSIKKKKSGADKRRESIRIEFIMLV